MSRAPFVVAIDGPAGVGKSTAARSLAARLRVPYLDTGAMYRSIALHVLDSGVDPSNRAAAETTAEAAPLEVVLEAGTPTSAPRLEVYLARRPVGERIRTPEVTAAASVLAAHPGVRRRLVALQREAGRRFGGVVEGRDIGTRVFPDTPHKFFLDADPRIRYQRRHAQLAAAGSEIPLDRLAREMGERDRRDAERSDSPLTCDSSYNRVDTSTKTPEEVVETMASAVEAALRRSSEG